MRRVAAWVRGASASPDARWLAAILALAAVVRALVVWRTPGYVPFGDAADYDRLAASLAYLGQYGTTGWAAPGGPTAFRGPAYPYLLSWVYEATGARWGAARSAGVILGTISVALVWEIARRLAGLRVARWSALVWALLPTSAWLAAGLVSEVLFVPLLLGVVAAALVHRDRPHLAWPLLVGALGGLALLTRSTGVVVLLPVAVGLWTARRRLRDPLVALVVAGLVLAPWAARNHREFGRLLPFGTHSGFTLAGAWNSGAAAPGDYFAASHLAQTVPDTAELFTPNLRDEAQLDRELRSRALRFGREHPGFVLRATGAHLLRLLMVGQGQAHVGRLSAREMGVPETWRWTLRPPILVVAALALLALALTVRRRLSLGPLWVWAVPLLLLATTAPVVGAPRYRLPLDPFLVIAATAAAGWAIAAIRR